MAATIRYFLDETRSRLDALRANRGDAEAVTRTARNLTGSCATFAAAEMAALSSELEAASTRAGFQITDAALAQLDDRYARVAVELGRVFRIWALRARAGATTRASATYGRPQHGISVPPRVTTTRSSTRATTTRS